MDLSGLRVKELNEICRKFEGIRTGGRKADIVERIEASDIYQTDAAVVASKHRRAAAGSNKRSATHSIESAAASTKKQKGARQAEVTAIDAVFDKFRDPEAAEAAITEDGILALCDALGVDPQDPVVLALSCAMEADSMCVYTRAEFRRGLEKLHCHTLADLRRQLPFLRRQLDDRTQFAAIYSFTFDFAKDSTQKSLARELALALWELLLPGRFPWRGHWLRFLQKNWNKAVSRDLWLQTLEFGLQIHPDMANFDENGAWPVLLDDFAADMLDRIATRGFSVVQQEEEALCADAGKTDEEETMVVDS